MTHRALTGQLAHSLACHGQVLQSRKVVNTIYFVVPPIGLLFMFLSPFFSTRERVVRTLMMASFMFFFAVMGPQLRAEQPSQTASVSSAH